MKKQEESSRHSQTTRSLRPAATAEGAIIGRAGMYKSAIFAIRSGEEMVIGRDAALSHIIVDMGAEKVSRKHCSVMYDGQSKRYFVTDFSSNGTYQESGARLSKNVATPLLRGTVLYIGNKKNSFILN